MTGPGGPAAPANPIDAPGTREETWRGWPGLARLPAADLAGWRSVVILAAHPDDEVLGVGGLICQLALAGARLRLVAVTDGEASHPGGDPDALVRRRARERAAALTTLGAVGTEVVRLGLPDSGLAAWRGDLSLALRDLVDGFDVCLAPWEADAHADHELVGRAARRLGGQVLFYPVWMWHWAQPGDARVPWASALRVPLPGQVAALKQAAIGCFGSQLESRPPAGPILSGDFVAHFTRDYEVLFPVHRP